MGPYWYRNFNNFGTTWDFYERLVKELMGNEEVTKQAELKDTVTMKIRKGGKVYRVILTEITPEEDKIEVEFEGDEPSKHPDYTE
jgi:hypothetical protein|tara:strand:+ start:5296 stop:5550 length:255 start_codon:yes stop_codon:yes gene_type:complete